MECAAPGTDANNSFLPVWARVIIRIEGLTRPLPAIRAHSRRALSVTAKVADSNKKSKPEPAEVRFAFGFQSILRLAVALDGSACCDGAALRGA